MKICDICKEEAGVLYPVWLFTKQSFSVKNGFMAPDSDYDERDICPNCVPKLPKESA